MDGSPCGVVPFLQPLIDHYLELDRSCDLKEARHGCCLTVIRNHIGPGGCGSVPMRCGTVLEPLIDHYLELNQSCGVKEAMHGRCLNVIRNHICPGVLWTAPLACGPVFLTID